MAKYPNDDLFEGTKMSFGEHLEELRVCLFRAVVFLIIGFCIGLGAAKYVMRFMQTPLTTALENYYIEKTIDDLRNEYQDHVTPAVENVVRNNRLVFDYMYVEYNEFRRVNDLLTELRQAADERVEGSAQDTKESTADDSSSNDADATQPTPAEKSEPGKEDPAQKALEVIGHDIPPPSSHLVRTRIWKPARMKVTSLSAQEAFMIWMKAGLISGIVMASPFIFWQVWLFVAAGLYPHEKNYVYIYLPFSLLLFLAGAAMAFGFVFKPVLDFLFDFNKSLNIDPDPRISEWLGFVMILPLGFGVSFQLPLVMLFLNRIGLIAFETYTKNWRVAILAIFVISALLTPADPISIFLMAGPLTVLYFLGLGLCRWMPRQKSPFAEAYEP